MTIDSVTDQLTKSLALIALGLLEKEQSPNPKKYTYSKRLMHGINLFLYTSDQYGGKPNVIQPFANEASFCAT